MWYPYFAHRCTIGPPSQAQLLGSPLGDDVSISVVLANKVEVLRRLGECLKFLAAHDALVLLRN